MLACVCGACRSRCQDTVCVYYSQQRCTFQLINVAVLSHHQHVVRNLSLFKPNKTISGCFEYLVIFQNQFPVYFGIFFFFLKGLCLHLKSPDDSLNRREGGDLRRYALIRTSLELTEPSCLWSESSPILKSVSVRRSIVG